MAQTTNLTIRLDSQDKRELEKLTSSFGMNMTTFFSIYVKQALKQRKIPFEIAEDPFYSAKNQERLDRSIADAQMGKLTLHELIEVDDDE
ncbi:MAG: type II toxin-antitoxin system antitoxin, RelB/DinJ family [Oscillospiraceae bacterium]|nr:type II toxin-antitoxin system antitoxin, RelB/DinJ family [Oscillospiraceae bacterium]